MLVQPVQHAFKELVNADMFRRLMESRIILPQAQLDQTFMEEIEKKTINLLCEVKKFTGGREDEIAIARELRHKLETILYLPVITSQLPTASTQRCESRRKIPE